MKKQLLLLLLLLVSVANSFAADFYFKPISSANSYNFNDIRIWFNYQGQPINGVPSANDNIIFLSSNLNGFTGNSLSINFASNTSVRDIIIDLSSVELNFSMSNSSMINVNGNLSALSKLTVQGLQSTANGLNFAGSADQTINVSSNSTLNYITVNKANANNKVTLLSDINIDNLVVKTGELNANDKTLKIRSLSFESNGKANVVNSSIIINSYKQTTTVGANNFLGSTFNFKYNGFITNAISKISSFEIASGNLLNVENIIVDSDIDQFQLKSNQADINPSTYNFTVKNFTNNARKVSFNNSIKINKFISNQSEQNLEIKNLYISEEFKFNESSLTCSNQSSIKSDDYRRGGFLRFNNNASIIINNTYIDNIEAEYSTVVPHTNSVISASSKNFAVDSRSPKTLKWVGGTGNWNIASNWDLNCVPTLIDSVVIDGQLGNFLAINNSDTIRYGKNIYMRAIKFMNINSPIQVISDDRSIEMFVKQYMELQQNVRFWNQFVNFVPDNIDFSYRGNGGILGDQDYDTITGVSHTHLILNAAITPNFTNIANSRKFKFLDDNKFGHTELKNGIIEGNNISLGFNRLNFSDLGTHNSYPGINGNNLKLNILYRLNVSADNSSLNTSTTDITFYNKKTLHEANLSLNYKGSYGSIQFRNLTLRDSSRRLNANINTDILVKFATIDLDGSISELIETKKINLEVDEFISNKGNIYLGKGTLKVNQRLIINEGLSCISVSSIGKSTDTLTVSVPNTSSFVANLASFTNFNLNVPVNAINSIVDNSVISKINVSNATTKEFYWIPNKLNGDWKDGANWTFDPQTNVPANCIPTQFDNVHFESLTSNIVVNAPSADLASCKNIFIRNNTNANQRVLFSAKSLLDIYGDINIDQGDSLSLNINSNDVVSDRYWNLNIVGSGNSNINLNNSGIKYANITLEKANANALISLNGNLFIGNPSTNTKFIIKKGGFITNNYNISGSVDMSISDSVNFGTSNIELNKFSLESTSRIANTNYILDFQSNVGTSNYYCELTVNKSNVTIPNVNYYVNKATNIKNFRIKVEPNGTTLNVNNLNVQRLENIMEFVTANNTQTINVNNAYLIAGKTYKISNGANIVFTGDFEASGNACGWTKVEAISPAGSNYNMTLPSNAEIDYVEISNMNLTAPFTFGASSVNKQNNNANVQFLPNATPGVFVGLGSNKGIFCDEFPLNINSEGFAPNSKSTFQWSELLSNNSKVNLSNAKELSIPNPGTYILSVNYGAATNCERADTVVIYRNGFELPTLPPSGLTLITDEYCYADSTGYLYADGGTNATFDKKGIAAIKANGNTGITENTITKVELSTIGNMSLPNVNNTNVAYYEYKDNNTNFVTRVSKRLLTVQVPGTHTTNGGAIVRVYFDPNDITAIQNQTGVTQFGQPIMSWFKSAKHSATDVLGDLRADNLLDAEIINPITTGTENGLHYAEFQVTTFSTFGYLMTNNNEALPIKLESFKGTSDGCNNELEWIVNDKDAVSFDVEWSNNGREFGVVATVNAANAALYHYTHTTKNAKNYYRLAMKEHSGNVTFSNIITLDNTSCNAQSIAVYPNPTSGLVTVKGMNNANIVKIYDAVGKLVKQLSIENNHFNMSTLSNGVYFIQIIDQDGAQIYSDKLMKK